MPVGKLDLRKTKVGDLAPLRGCPKLAFLAISETLVRDLRPVLGLKLVELHLDGKTPIRDVSALAASATLERLTLPRNATGIEALRKHPRLQRIAFAWDPAANRDSAHHPSHAPSASGYSAGL